ARVCPAAVPANATAQSAPAAILWTVNLERPRETSPVTQKDGPHMVMTSGSLARPNRASLSSWRRHLNSSFEGGATGIRPLKGHREGYVATTFQARVGGERNAFGLPADVPLTATVDLKHFRRVGGQIA